jgi:hypothetical protein
MRQVGGNYVVLRFSRQSLFWIVRGLLRCYPIWTFRRIQTFRKNMMPPSSGYNMDVAISEKFGYLSTTLYCVISRYRHENLKAKQFIVSTEERSLNRDWISGLNNWRFTRCSFRILDRKSVILRFLCLGLGPSYNPAIFLDILRKTTKKFTGMAYVRYEIRTQYLPSAS